MTPEELDCVRAAIATGIPMDSGELGRRLLEHIDSQAEEIKRLEAENYQWRSYNHELGNKSHKQRLALKKLGEKVRARGKALVEEQVRRDMSHYYGSRYTSDELEKIRKKIRSVAREQLRSEGMIR
jgi:hypothetical protein